MKPSELIDIAIGSIVRDESQPRREFNEGELRSLADSLQAQGQLLPIIVVPKGSQFQLIEGERRWRAAQLAGLLTLRAIVAHDANDASSTLLMQLTINCMRADLKPLERAEAYQRLIDAGLQASEVAKRLGVDKSCVTRYLSHLKLSEELKQRLAAGTLSSSAAYALTRMSESERAEAVKELDMPGVRENLERKAQKHKPKSEDGSPKCKTIRYELPDCTLALQSSKAMTFESLIAALGDLLKACKKARSQQLEPSTMALVIRDKTRALQTAGGAS